MAIIDSSYFFGDLYIPQITEQSVLTSVNKYIAKYEPELLQDVFGYTIAKNINDYSAILNGAEFNNPYKGGAPDKWKGLKVDIGSGKYWSLIANYVYVRYTQDNVSFSTGSGEKVIEQATSKTVSPVMKIKRAWDEMAKEILTVIAFMQSDRLTYSAYQLGYTKSSLTRIMNPLF